MGMKPWLIAGALLISTGAFAFSPHISDPRLAPILKFYEDCTFVAENCPRQQISTVLHMIQKGGEPSYSLLDVKARRIYAAIHHTQEMILQPDPLIHGPFPSLTAYVYKVLSTRVLWSSETTARIEVARESVEASNQPAGPRVTSSHLLRDTEIDEWIKVGDTWKVRMVRYVLSSS